MPIYVRRIVDEVYDEIRPFYLSLCNGRHYFSERQTAFCTPYTLVNA